MTIRQLLRSIDNRLARLERQQRQQLAFPCCPTTPDGLPIPAVVPRQTPNPLPGGSDNCLRVAGALQQQVINYNTAIDIVSGLDEDLITAAAISEVALLQWSSVIAVYLTSGIARRLAVTISETLGEALTVYTDNVDWCEATRQYSSNTGEPPDELTAHSSPAARLAFSLFWQLTGGIAWASDVPVESLPVPEGITPACCLPDQFLIVGAPNTLVCGSNTYSVIMVDDTVPYVNGVIVSPGVIPRASIAGRYLWSVEGGGAFSLKLWYSSTPNMSITCNNHDVVLSGGVNWRVSASGSPYLLIRNITDYESTYLICSRSPYDSNANTTDI